MGASCAKVEKDSSALIIPSWEELPLEDEGLEASCEANVIDRKDSIQSFQNASNTRADEYGKPMTGMFSSESTMDGTGVLSESLVSRLSCRSMLVDVHEVQRGEVLNRTLKSQVCSASWQGTKAVAKQLLPGFKDHKKKNAELLHEIDILSSLQHPCLVRLLGANLFDDIEGTVMLTEFMAHGDVDVYMHKQRRVQRDPRYAPPFDVAMGWALDTGRALRYLHGLRTPIIHRDLKPNNMFLTNDLKVKLGDLGSSKVMPDHAADPSPAPRMTGGIGTWRYMAPEVARHQAYTEKVDIYSFSLVLYYIFTGLQPFYTWGDVELLLQAFAKGQEPRPELSAVRSRELRSFLEEAWHAESGRRPSAGECLLLLNWTPNCGLGYRVDRLKAVVAQKILAELEYGSDRSGHVAQERVIILDWDDTPLRSEFVRPKWELMPTSFLRDALKIYPSCRYIPSSRTGLRKKTRSATSGLPCQAGLEAHCTLVRELLIAARSVAHVAIVTLAERPWVVDSAEQYMPSLNLPRLLRDLGIPVYYAVEYRKPSRNPLVPETPPACSKRLAMEDFILSLSRDFGSRFNLLSIGDSMAEREAARKASAALEKKASKAGEPLPYCKTVKLQTDPSLKMLTLELQAMLSNMDRLLAMNHDLDLIFEQQDSIEDIEELGECQAGNAHPLVGYAEKQKRTGSFEDG
ncbi:unnamed protein product [Effrenium voratum]|nr:unnamed protein product [Effrenium voratum]